MKDLALATCKSGKVHFFTLHAKLLQASLYRPKQENFFALTAEGSCKPLPTGSLFLHQQDFMPCTWTATRSTSGFNQGLIIILLQPTSCERGTHYLCFYLCFNQATPLGRPRALWNDVMVKEGISKETPTI